LKKDSGAEVVSNQDESCMITLPKGKSIEFFVGKLKEDRLIEPVAPQKNRINYYGLR
jgi:hypothetical protein